MQNIRMTIFILGCGIMQTPALKLARSMGWHVAAADADTNAPGRALCHEFHHVDLKDSEGLIEAAKTIHNGKGPNGVFTAGTDFSLSAAIVAEHLSLPGHSVEAARAATDKVLMRQIFKQAGIPCPLCIEITTWNSDSQTTNENAQIQHIIETMPPPWVVKPVDSMGARGVIRIDQASELIQAVTEARKHSRSGRALVESYMEGPEYSLDALLTDGQFLRCGLADRIIQYPPYFIETGHTIPSAADSSTIEQLWQVFEEGSKALGLTHGAAKGDIKMTPQGPMVGEIAARLSGGYMSGWTMPAATGIHPTQAALRLAVGLAPTDIRPKQHLVCAERALTGIDGTILKLNGREAAMEIPGIKEVFLRCKPGDRVSFPRNNVEKAANVIAIGTTHKKADAQAQAALQILNLELDPTDQSTGTYLDEHSSFPPDAFPAADYFTALWTIYPPRPSLRRIKHRPAVSPPEDLPEHQNLYGQTMGSILNILTREGLISIRPPRPLHQQDQDASDIWKALVRGGLPGLRWLLTGNS